jgi:hypothetical protein
MPPGEGEVIVLESGLASCFANPSGGSPDLPEDWVFKPEMVEARVCPKQRR